MAEDYPPIILGFIEGLMAPILEVLIVMLLLVGSLIQQATNVNSPNIPLMASIFLIVDFVRNIIIGLSRSQFAVGNAIGNFLGLWLFLGVIGSVSPEAATNSILLAVALFFSLGISVYLYIRNEPQPLN